MSRCPWFVSAYDCYWLSDVGILHRNVDSGFVCSIWIRKLIVYFPCYKFHFGCHCFHYSHICGALHTLVHCTTPRIGAPQFLLALLSLPLLNYISSWSLTVLVLLGRDVWSSIPLVQISRDCHIFDTFITSQPGCQHSCTMIGSSLTCLVLHCLEWCSSISFNPRPSPSVYTHIWHSTPHHGAPYCLIVAALVHLNILYCLSKPLWFTAS